MSRASAEPPRAAPGSSLKSSHSKDLTREFAAILSARLAGRDRSVGPQAGYGIELADGFALPGSSGIVPETGPGLLDRATAGTELDPLARSLAVPLASPPLGMTPATDRAGAELGNPAAGAPDLTGLEEAVRRIAWGGDRRRGVARIELGGEHGGTTVEVRGEGREVSLRIELGRGRDAGSLPERIAERLRARGLALTDVEVR